MRKTYHSRAMEMVRLALKSRAQPPSTPQPTKKFRSGGNLINVQLTMDSDSCDEVEPPEGTEAEEISAAEITTHLASNEPSGSQKALCPDSLIKDSNAPALAVSDAVEEIEALEASQTLDSESDQSLVSSMAQDEEKSNELPK